MTVKELVNILNTLPSDAIVTYTGSRFIVDDVDYDRYDNTIIFVGDREFGVEYEDDLVDVDDDVDETNYDPYCGCDMFEICGSIDEEW